MGQPIFQKFRVQVCEIDKAWTRIHQEILGLLSSTPGQIPVHATCCDIPLHRVFIERGCLFYQEHEGDAPQPWGEISAEQVRAMTPKSLGHIVIRPRTPGQDPGIVAQMIMCGMLVEIPT